MNAETPTIKAMAYGLNSSNPWNIPPQQWIGNAGNQLDASMQEFFNRQHQDTYTIATTTQQQPMANTSRRIVQVFIADPNPNVPLEKSIIYQDEKPRLTDLSDQELYFEIPIKGLLDQHNQKRVNWLDKEATKRSGKDAFLEPAKIRDLNMTVVTVVQF